ncbi:ankyrin repeat-containing protein, partial [Podospora aff. communis PSN243]
WERWRNAIHGLYILDNLPPKKVKEAMEIRHCFYAKQATAPRTLFIESQYIYQFKKWRFQKHMVTESYPVIESKLGKRKRQGKESNVYWRGQLIPAAKLRKELSRHGTKPTLAASYRGIYSVSPLVPADVQIFTPPPYHLFRSVFLELPTLGFLRSVMSAFVSSLSSASSIPNGTVESLQPDRALSSPRALLPLNAFEQEAPGPDMSLGNFHRGASAHILKVVAYAVSNNFPGHGDEDRRKIHVWFKNLLNVNPDIITLLQSSSSPALLQGLFRLAVEQQDLQATSALLSAGASPNENLCLWERLPFPLRPIQFACLRGNLELVRQLLRSKAQLDHYESGLFCSPLILAIHGFFQDFWPAPPDIAEHHDESNDDVYSTSAARRLREVEALLILVKDLLSAGTDLNSMSVKEEALSTVNRGEDSIWYPILDERHSTLTLASSYRQPELVNLLIQNGADVNFRINGCTSALRECLFNWKERIRLTSNPDFRLQLGVLEVRMEDLEDLGRPIDTANLLIIAGIDLNDYRPCSSGELDCIEEGPDLGCYSAHDLAILTKDSDLVESLRGRGAIPTRHSFDTAIQAGDYDSFCQALESDIDFIPWNAWADREGEVRSTAAGQLAEWQKRLRAKSLAAMHCGNNSALADLIQSSNCSDIFRNYDALRDAIEKCSSRGDGDTLGLLIQGDVLPQGPRASIFGSSVGLAVREGHAELIDVLLAAGADVNAAVTINVFGNRELDSPLGLAIAHGQPQMVQKLLNAGAEVENFAYGNLLVQAILGKHQDIIQMLMPHAWWRGPYLHSGLFTDGNYWMTPLSAAIFKEQWVIVEQLIELGAAINPEKLAANEPRSVRTPLSASVFHKRAPLVYRLLEKGAEVDNDALMVAAGQEDPAMLRLLLENLSAKTQPTAAEGLQVSLCETMTRAGTPAANFHLVLQSKLLNLHSFPAAIYEALDAHHPFHRQEFLQSLLDAGANPNTVIHRYGFPQTALLQAIHQADPSCARIILDTRATTNTELPLGAAYSPLQLAAFRGNRDIVEMLLEYGQDPNLAPVCLKRQEPCVQNATMKKSLDILRALLQHNENPNSITALCQHTALQIACREGSMEMVELLVEYGANVNAPPASEFGATALQFSAIGGYLGIALFLLDKDAKVNAEPAEKEGRTALEGAAEHGRIDMVQMLKNAGADISESGNGQWERALQRALDNGHSATAALLSSFKL